MMATVSGGVIYVAVWGAGQVHATQGWLRGRVEEERKGREGGLRMRVRREERRGGKKERTVTKQAL